MRGMTRCAGQGHRAMTDTKASPYEHITVKILANLERGVRPLDQAVERRP